MPSFGLVYTMTIALVLIIAAVPISIRPTPKGMWLSFFPASARAARAFEPAIVLRMEKEDSFVRMYLDSRRISSADLHAELRKKFSTRPNWIVYVDGDADLPWGGIAQVIDVIQRAQGKPILLRHSHR